jgi:hypothetical protein
VIDVDRRNGRPVDITVGNDEVDLARPRQSRKVAFVLVFLFLLFFLFVRGRILSGAGGGELNRGRGRERKATDSRARERRTPVKEGTGPKRRKGRNRWVRWDKEGTRLLANESVLG